MKTEFGGEPVAGGTFPALIWRKFVLQAKAILEQRAATPQGRRRARRRDRQHAARRSRSAGDTTPHAGERDRHRQGRRHGGDGKGSEAGHEGRGDPGARRHAGPGDTDTGSGPTPGRPRSPTAATHRRRQRPAGLATAPRRARRAAARPGGSGRETCGLPAAQKRHGSSTALRDADPRAGDDLRLDRPRRGSIRTGPSCEARAVAVEPDARAPG